MSYNITWEPVPNAPYNKLPPDLDREIERLHNLIRTDPARAVVELEKWIEKYPDAAKLYNFLSAAYLGVDDTVNSERIVRENYRRHPDYLFAKLNYAELCLRGGEVDEIPTIFNNKYEISLLYPERKCFHITECTSFLAIMGWYFCAKGEADRAEFYLSALRKDVLPDDPRDGGFAATIATPRVIGRDDHDSAMGRVLPLAAEVIEPARGPLLHGSCRFDLCRAIMRWLTSPEGTYRLSILQRNSLGALLVRSCPV